MSEFIHQKRQDILIFEKQTKGRLKYEKDEQGLPGGFPGVGATVIITTSDALIYEEYPMIHRFLLFSLALLFGLSNTVFAQQSLRDFLNTKQATSVEATVEDATEDVSFTVQADKERYQNGDSFTLAVKSQQDGYLYIHNMVPNEEPVQMFPLNGETNHIEVNTAIQYPKPGAFYKWKINQESAKERVLVTFSPKELSETELKESLLNKRVEIFSTNSSQIKQVLLELPVGVNPASAPAAKKRVAVIVSQMFVFLRSEARVFTFQDPNINFRTGNFIHVYSALKKSKDFEKIYVLSFRDLNKKNLRRLFQKLKEETSPGDEIFLYWESHGGRGEDTFPDFSGTEISGSHEYLFLGGCTCEGVLDPEEALTDDEFADLLFSLKDRRIMVLMQTCHSGGVLQSTTSHELSQNILFDEFQNKILERAEKEYDYESLFKLLPSILEGTSFAQKLPGSNTVKSDGISLREFINSTSRANSEAESLIVKAIEKRVNSVKDIGPNHPNIAIITTAAFNELAWSALFDKNLKCLTYDFSKNKWLMMGEEPEGVFGFVGPHVFGLLVAMMDTSGIFNEDPKRTDFEDVWKILKELIPLNNERVNRSCREDKPQKSQTPQFFNSAGKILLRTRK